MLDGLSRGGYLRARYRLAGDGPMSEAKRRRRRRTGFWFAFYTLALLVIAGISVWTHQWSLAGTTLAVAAVFFLFTRWFVRRR